MTQSPDTDFLRKSPSEFSTKIQDPSEADQNRFFDEKSQPRGARSLKALSVLLSYPTADLQAAIPEIRALLHDVPVHAQRIEAGRLRGAQRQEPDAVLARQARTGRSTSPELGE